MAPTRRLVNVIPYEDDVRFKRVTYEQVKKSCGKTRCRTCSGVRLVHGPYWQLVEWDEGGRRSRTTYIGKQLPPEAQEALVIRRFLSDPSFRRLVQESDALVQELRRREKEVVYLTHRVAELQAELVEARSRTRGAAPQPARLDRAAKLYRELARKYHPDRNPAAAEVMRDINQLWQMVKS